MVLAGCAQTPRVEPRPQSSPVHAVGYEIAMRAMALLGSPYRFGADGPHAFDCSGLVRYVHGQLGIAAPRTAAEQYSAARRVELAALVPGDLLFFKLDGGRVSHVAIYAGDSRFVHAPQTGRTVELRTLDDAFYRPRLAGAGRLF